jgi:hypothetical protein
MKYYIRVDENNKIVGVVESKGFYEEDIEVKGYTVEELLGSTYIEGQVVVSEENKEKTLLEELSNIFSKKIFTLKQIAIDKPYMSKNTVETQFETYEKIYELALKTPKAKKSKAVIQKHEEVKALTLPLVESINNQRSICEKLILKGDFTKAVKALKKFREMDLKI